MKRLAWILLRKGKMLRATSTEYKCKCVNELISGIGNFVFTIPNPLIIFRAFSLDVTHHLLQKRATGHHTSSNIVIDFIRVKNTHKKT